jgi:hypothetical protein
MQVIIYSVFITEGITIPQQLIYTGLLVPEITLPAHQRELHDTG